MCPSSVRPCGICSYTFVEYELKGEGEETMLLCASCFMGRCIHNIKKGAYPPGATMDEFREQLLSHTIT